MAIDFSTPPASRITIHPEPQQAKAPKEQAVASKDSFWGEDGFGFDDLIDIINPLQHIPVVSTIYREITGDEIAPGPRMLGGGIVGGVVGFVASAANVIFEQETGKDVGGAVVAALVGEENSQPQPTAMAAVVPAVSPTVRMMPTSAETVEIGMPIELIKEQALIAQPAAQQQEQLEPLDFSDIELPPRLPDVTEEEKEEANAILQLFGQTMQDVTNKYQASSILDHVYEVAEEMKA